MYLNEQRLSDALLPFLATALFGPERTDYWRHALDAATQPERTAPARERASEIEAEITDLERRLTRQLVNLEADDVTLADVAPLLDRLPISILATSLDAAPQGELRALFAALQLDVVYQPADGAVDAAVTLYDRGSDTGEVAVQVRAEDWSVPPAGFEPAHPAPEADALSPELRGLKT